MNGTVTLKIPQEVIKEKCDQYSHKGKPRVRLECLNDTVFSTISLFQTEYRGLVNYYQMANNLRSLGRLEWIMTSCLLKTIGRKLKLSARMTKEKFGKTIPSDSGPRKVLEERVEREGKKPLVAQWGGISLKRNKTFPLDPQLMDRLPPRVAPTTAEILQRLLANECELCGSREKVEVHHVRKLKELRSDKTLTAWKVRMSARKRKTLIVCRKCHEAIHNGKPTATRPQKGSPESRMI
jgi:hypothetical protein